MLSAAVTVYFTGLVKFCGTPLAGFTLAPVIVIVGVNDDGSVPYGTVSAIVFAPIVPAMPKIENAVISFAGLSATVTVTV